MAKFACDGFRPVEAESAREAAEIFATRQARRDYGRKGHCRTIRLDSWTENGKSHTFEAFIGKPVPGDRSATSGRNVWVYVRAALRPALVVLGLALLPGMAAAQDAPPAAGGPEVTREAFLARAERAAARRFARMDTDNNGALSREERAADRQRQRDAWQARQARAAEARE
jgi:hypothetical protein